MPVAFISNGYDTTSTNPYTEAAWADAHPSIGYRYGVRSPLHWKVTPVAGLDRTVSIAAGQGFGHGITDKTVDNETIQLDTIGAGSRWDLIAVRRDWTPTAGESKFVKINGGSTAVIPGARLVGPGNIDDQPIALVQVTAGQTQPTNIIDLRTWAGDGGGLVGVDPLVLSFLNSTGTRINIQGVDWTRKPGANDVPVWVPGATSGADTISIGAGASSATKVIQFPVKYPTPPIPVVSLASNIAGNASALLVSGYSATETGFTAKVQTNDNTSIGTSYNLTLNWVALPAAG